MSGKGSIEGCMPRDLDSVVLAYPWLKGHGSIEGR